MKITLKKPYGNYDKGDEISVSKARAQAMAAAGICEKPASKTAKKPAPKKDAK